MAELEEFEVEAGGFTFSALGAGPPDGRLVLFLHGFPQRALEWRHQLSALGDAGYRAVAFDQRGYSAGARPEEIEQYGATHLVADVLAVADQMGGHQFDLVGHDWGAALTWMIGAAYPSRLRSITALSVPHPFAFFSQMEGEQGTLSAYMTFFRQPDVPEEILLSDDAELLRAIFTGVSSNRVAEKARTVGFAAGAGRTGLSDEDAELYVSLMREPGVLTKAINWYRARIDGGAKLAGNVEVPTMYVWSTNDFALGRDAAMETEKYVTGPYRFEVLDGISHWIPDEAPDQLNTLLLEHLTTHA